MTPEEKAAAKAAKAAAMVAAPAIVIRNASQLMPLKALKTLRETDPDKADAYIEAAEVFVESFNEKYPDGKVVKASLKEISLKERVNFVVYKHDDLSTQVFSFDYKVADAIADKLGVVDVDGLDALVRQLVDPLPLTLTVRAVAEGDTYKTKDGMREYKNPATVKIDGSREELELTEEAKDILADLYRTVLAAKVAKASANKRNARNPKATAKAVPAGEEHEEDDSDV